jgi:hypothetical protein
MLTAGALVGRLVSEALPRAADLRAMRALAGLTESGQSYRDEFKVEGGDQGRWVAITAVRIDDAIAVTASDVTARKRGERMLAASNAELERRV